MRFRVDELEVMAARNLFVRSPTGNAWSRYAGADVLQEAGRSRA
jgi:hypothetical protein